MPIWRDTRVGFNATMIFDHGTLTHVFGPADERWAPVDEQGDPITDGPTFSLDELDPDVEYDTVLGALELGFQTFGSWSRETLWEYLYVADTAIAEP